MAIPGCVGRADRELTTVVVTRDARRVTHRVDLGLAPQVSESHWCGTGRQGTILVVLTPRKAREVLTGMVETALDGSPEERSAAAALLSALPGRSLLRLDDAARQGTWATQAPVSGAERWRNARLAEESGLTAAICSMHADGHLREAAVRALAGRPGVPGVASLALRCADHVPEVREAARRGLAVQTDLEQAASALAVLVAVSARQHGADALDGYVSALFARHGSGLVLELTSSRDTDVRRWAYRYGLEASLLPTGILAAAARSETDQLIRRLCAERFARIGEPEVVREMLQSRYVDGRLSALTHLTDDYLTEDEIRAGLLDRSARVRETAQWRARRRRIDPVIVYRAATTSDLTAAAQSGCLAGLAGTGDRSDLPLIEAHLTDPRPSVRAAAVRAAAALANPDERATLVGPFLLDESPQVATAAAQAVIGSPATSVADLVETAWRSEQVWSRGAAWRLERSAGSWDRVEADLRAATDPDPDLRRLGGTGIANWLVVGAARTWQVPSGAQAVRIRGYLERADINEKAVRTVAFHAGVTSPSPRNPAGVGDDASVERKARRGWPIPWWRREPPR
jgi:hypothetical protein